MNRIDVGYFIDSQGGIWDNISQCEALLLYFSYLFAVLLLCALVPSFFLFIFSNAIPLLLPLALGSQLYAAHCA